MSIVTLQLSDVMRKSGTRPKECPYCRGETFQGWGRVRKPVRDNRHRSIRFYRYCCCHCRRTLRQAQGRLLRHYPACEDRDLDNAIFLPYLSAEADRLSGFGQLARSSIRFDHPCRPKLVPNFLERQPGQ